MTQPVYRAAPPADLADPVALEAFTLIYHRRSGATHLLSEPAPEILEVLAEGPADAATVAARLALRYGLESEEAIETVLAERLAELAALGLVEAA